MSYETIAWRHTDGLTDIIISGTARWAPDLHMAVDRIRDNLERWQLTSKRFHLNETIHSSRF